MNKTLFQASVALLVVTRCSVLRAAPPEACTAAYQKKIAAQTVPASSVYVVISQEQQSGCILGPTDNSGIEQMTEELRAANTGAEKAVLRKELFEAVLAQFEGYPTVACTEDTLACAAGRHVSNMRNLQEAVNAENLNARDAKLAPLLAAKSWPLIPATGSIEISKIHLAELLTHECTDGADGTRSPQCIAAVEFAAKTMRTSEAMRQVVDMYSQPIIEANAQFLTVRDKEWNSYMNDVSVQYPWELWANGLIFQKVTPLEERAKFPRAPSSKWVFLHPSPGFERVEGPTGGHSTQASVLIEFVGYEKWRWSGGAASNRWGASLVTSFVDATGSHSVGYGVLLKTPFKNASVGAIWRKGDRGQQVNLMINVDLAKLIEQYKDVDVKGFLGKALSGQGVNP